MAPTPPASEAPSTSRRTRSLYSALKRRRLVAPGPQDQECRHHGSDAVRSPLGLTWWALPIPALVHKLGEAQLSHPSLAERPLLIALFVALAVGACTSTPPATPTDLPRSATPTERPPSATRLPSATAVADVSLWELPRVERLLSDHGVEEVSESREGQWIGDGPSRARVSVRSLGERVASVIVSWGILPDTSSEAARGHGDLVDFVVSTWAGRAAAEWLGERIEEYSGGSHLNVSEEFDGPAGPVSVTWSTIPLPFGELFLAQVDRKLDPGEPTPPPPATPSTGKWIVFDIDVDPITDQPTTNAMLVSEAGEILDVRCTKDGKTELYITWFKQVGSAPTVEWRVGGSPASRGFWNVSSSGVATGYPSTRQDELIRLVKSMFGESQLIVRVNPPSRVPITATFSITGIESALANVRSACNW
jgi:hypothetical protein